MSGWSLSARRAWIEIEKRSRGGYITKSLSARRAWIEIPDGSSGRQEEKVALRKESVDRNNVSANYHIRVREVALRKESVDRNHPVICSYRSQFLSRSPQGERG